MSDEDVEAVPFSSETSEPPAETMESKEISSSSVMVNKDESSNEDKHDAKEAPKESLKIELDYLVEKARRIVFTDASVAIALTLLILPLMDAAVDSTDEDITTLKWFQQNKDLLLTFFISYMVVAFTWVDHDGLFRTVANFNRLLSILNFQWLLTIVFLPTATNIMNSVVDDPFQHFIYIGTMLLASIWTFLMTIVVHRNPIIWEGNGPSFSLLVSFMVSIVLLAASMFLSITPGGYWMLMILFLKRPIIMLIWCKWPNLNNQWEESAEPVSSATSNNRYRDEDISGVSIVNLMQGLDELVEAERRINFTDAAAAIALTLLVLPLMDAATEARGEDLSTTEWFQENKVLLLSFFLSYMVVIICWLDQDRLVRKIAYFTSTLTVLNFLWLLAVVFIPVSTSVMNLVEDDFFQHVIYIGTPLLAKLWTLCMTIEGER